MKIPKSTTTNVALITIIFALMVSLIVATAVSDYDPYADVNDDGIIDIYDLFALATCWQTTGTPINKRALLEGGMITPPAYDSGWVEIEPWTAKAFHHNLGTENLLVYMVGRCPAGDLMITHQCNYGGTYEWNEARQEAYYYGAHWQYNDENTIWVERLKDDDLEGYSWEEVRVLIWIIPEPIG